jgi:hypothetical protein
VSARTTLLAPELVHQDIRLFHLLRYGPLPRAVAQYSRELKLTLRGALAVTLASMAAQLVEV